MKNYIKKIRNKIGKDRFIHPAARIIVENRKGEILFIERKDNGQLGVPAGALEENETIEACIKREVLEETGLKLLQVEVIGISSNPLIENVEYPNGDKIQYFTIEFYCNEWEGALNVIDKEEIKTAKFLSPIYINQLPRNERSAFESLEYFRIKNKIMLK